MTDSNQQRPTLIAALTHMNLQEWPVKPVGLPPQSAVCDVYAKTDLADAYAIRLPDHASGDPELLARFIFSQQASWVATLMRVRDIAVAGFGLKTSDQLKASPATGAAERIYIFRIFTRSPLEVIMGEDDKHLDFRVSVLLQVRNEAPEPTRYLIVSTVVTCHNLLGRTYIALIAPFHRLIVQSGLRRAARAGWPSGS